MTWSPANLTDNCFRNRFVDSCEPSFLFFLNFLTQYVSHSLDEKFNSGQENKSDLVNNQDEYDFIIVGAGSAGCVLANRLSEITDWKVLLLENGEEEPVISEIPGIFTLLMDSSIDYMYKIQQDPLICRKESDPSCALPRGNVMGGTSTINRMGYTRGNRQDYDDWSNLGNEGWSYDEVLPYFKKSENLLTPENLVPVESFSNHGTSGYLSVEIQNYTKDSQAILDAWKELGIQEIDHNSGNNLGASRWYTTTKNGSRQSTNVAFLRPIRDSRPNLVIKTNSRVTKIIIDKEKKQAVGVEYVNSNNTVKAFARKEVIVSAGVFGSPQLLMLSGIGPDEYLREAGIETIQELAVGKNFHDHVEISTMIIYTTKEIPRSFKTAEDKINDTNLWLRTHEGPFRYIGQPYNMIFLNTSVETREGVPDILITYTNYMIEESSYSNLSSYEMMAYNGIGFRDAVELLPARSRGYLKLNKTDPIWSQPVIYGNYLTDPTDIASLVEGAKMSNRISQTEAFKKAGFVGVRRPVRQCMKFWFNDSQYFECIIKLYGISSWHPVGTCKMGPKNDSEAVVDPSLKVYGIKSLRVVDGSIMPNVTSGNTNVPIIMFAEKVSDMIKKDWLPDFQPDFS